MQEWFHLANWAFVKLRPPHPFKTDCETIYCARRGHGSLIMKNVCGFNDKHFKSNIQWMYVTLNANVCSYVTLNAH